MDALRDRVATVLAGKRAKTHALDNQQLAKQLLPLVTRYGVARQVIADEIRTWRIRDKLKLAHIIFKDMDEFDEEFAKALANAKTKP